MSVIQSWSEQLPRDELLQFARANPQLPRVLGIDPGQCRLGMALLAPDPHHRATSARDVRFVMLGWVGVSCQWTATNAEGRRLVLRALEAHIDLMAFASQVVLERQHKRNGRMKALARAIIGFVRARVPRGSQMTVLQRDARHKFANLAALPCPMPRDYGDRKDAVVAAVDMQLRQTAGHRWMRFLQTHNEMRRDLCDAVAIAQDAVVAQPRFLLEMVRRDKLGEVSAHLQQRRRQNTWRRRSTAPVRPGISHLLTASAAGGASDSEADESGDSDSDDAVDQSLARFANMPSGIMRDLRDRDDDDGDAENPSKRRRRPEDEDVRTKTFAQLVSKQK